MDRQDPESAGMLAEFGITPDAELVWRCFIEHPEASIEYLGRHTGLSGEDIQVAVESLKNANLVNHARVPAGVQVVNPSLSLESHIGRAERQLSERLEELNALRVAIPQLAADYSRARTQDGEAAGVEIVLALEDIRRQIYLASEACQHDSRNLHHASSAAGLADARQSSAAIAGRGVRSRSIFAADQLTDPKIYAELSASVLTGQEYRTFAGGIPTRLLIYDRNLAVVAIDPNDVQNGGALFVRVPSLIDLLITLFEQMWATAEPIFTSPRESHGPTGRSARVLELMAVGTKDERVARTLGIGVRTVRREIADLKTMLGVQSRAEIAAAAVRKGWL